MGKLGDREFPNPGLVMPRTASEHFENNIGVKQSDILSSLFIPSILSANILKGKIKSSRITFKLNGISKINFALP